jgi:adenosylcobinamide-GDP ribazoletransferase
MNDLRTALGLLTIFPIRGQSISARALAYYPLVGLLIGVLLMCTHFLLRLVLPNLAAAALLVAVWALLTGALHLDGFSDACDGLFAAATRERRLEIMHDVHLGAFGTVGLTWLVITKVVFIAGVSNFIPLLLAPILGRWALVYAATYPTARSEGMAVLFRTGLTRRVILVASISAAILAAICGGFGLAAFLTAFIMATFIARFAQNRLGGLTGDVYGMICESVELGVLLIGNLAL